MTFNPVVFRAEILSSLDRHADVFGVPAGRHAVLRSQIANGDDIHSRRTFPGHVTTSAIVLDGKGARTLLIHHRSLARWLQPGGHYEPPETLPQSAMREAAEETGLEGLTLDSWHLSSGVPIDIDSHLIPARPEKDEPEHWHHDFRFIVRAEAASAPRPDLAEVQGAEWRPLDDLMAIAPQAVLNMRRLGLVLP
ncbi:8-oxo-dGTP pyrophosphatase MutT (NUDIX family) [Microvirga flocculans]|uniref:8-oxo-dGTP pyrophosphatase MutT (NUDIX family) n=1 Tax=Microvirga flocculans TaxID=217168 RepID=A0A7W6IEK5_9HYPH|nr:NUDIX hydrolase [Microvirga flocculans]MBB4040027.1 8-oxo-dGTP pyrophosphatase MutT (NUDIX family) [Microvirga flocculans]